MPDPNKLNIDKAFEVYQNFIYVEEKFRMMKERGIGIAGSVSSEEWELFGSVLTNQKASAGYGADLENAEVKSRELDENGNAGFEYQYHLHGGEEKLKEDMIVNHFFIGYYSGYRDVEVWGIDGESLSDKFESWLPSLKERYKSGESNNRFRKNITMNQVKNRGGEIVMKIRNTNLVRVNRQPTIFD